MPRFLIPLLVLLQAVAGSLPVYAAATLLPNGQQCFQATSPTSGGLSGPLTTLGTVTGGSGYVNGTYTNVPLTGGSGFGATATIIVLSGSVASASITNPGSHYSAGDILSATTASLGGSGSGFSVPVISVSTTGTGMIGLLGAITGGSGGIAGTYPGVALTGGSGSGATANITVAGGAVTAIAILNPGLQYVVGDTLSAASGSIGGVTGFSVPVSSVQINQALAGGQIFMYVPNTVTFKQTWQNAAQTALNTNPVTLDQNGCATIYGTGNYRQVLQDALGNTVWDKITADTSAQQTTFWAGLAGGTANAITVIDSGFNGTDGSIINFTALLTNTGPTTLNPSSFGNIAVLKDTTLGPQSLGGREIVANNPISVIYRTVDNSFHILNSVLVNNLYTGGIWSNGTPPANISRLDRLLVSTATLSSGLTPPTGSEDWLETLIPQSTSIAQLASITPLSGIGVLGGARTSDNPARDSLANTAFVNNNTANALGWAFYGEAWNNTAGGTNGHFTTAMELDIVNKNTTLVSLSPYTIDPGGETVTSWLASGGSRSGAQTASAAIVVLDNGAKFDKGLIFSATAFGAAGAGTPYAITMAANHKLAWFNNINSESGSITGVAAGGGGMVFNTGITTTVPTLVMDGANHLDVTSGLTPSLIACGTGPSVTGNDIAGTVTTGAGAGGCQLNFHTAYISTPNCVVTAAAGSIPAITARNNIGLTWTAAASTAYIYQCFGAPGG